jgi:hypothetical protein
MSGTTKTVCALLCVATALTAPVARADIAPPDVTCDTKGAACDNAAPNGVGAGVCSEGMPTTAFGRPSCGVAGATGLSNACLFCEAAGGGSGDNGGNGGSGTVGAGGAAGANTAGASGAGASAAGASNVAGASAQTSSSDGNDSGCSVRQLGSERGIAIFMLGLGLSALALGRRRR